MICICHFPEEEGRGLCADLYNLLNNEGLNLAHEVMKATISRMTGKSLKQLLDNLTDRDKRKLKDVLPDESHRILESETERESSFLVLYGLYRVILDDEQSPKSGWGNPVGETNVGISDDIERLYIIQSFVRENSDPKKIPIKNYIRRLDIMKEALKRLNHDAEFENNLTFFAQEISRFKEVLHV